MQFWWLPQLVVQVPLPVHRNVQLPPGQVNVQLAFRAQVISQPPPLQLAWQVELSVHV